MWRIDGLLKQHVKKTLCLSWGLPFLQHLPTCSWNVMKWSPISWKYQLQTSCRSKSSSQGQSFVSFSRVKLFYVYIATFIFGSFWYGFGPNQCDLTMWNLSHHLGGINNQIIMVYKLLYCWYQAPRLPATSAIARLRISSSCMPWNTAAATRRCDLRPKSGYIRLGAVSWVSWSVFDGNQGETIRKLWFYHFTIQSSAGYFRCYLPTNTFDCGSMWFSWMTIAAERSKRKKQQYCCSIG